VSVRPPDPERRLPRPIARVAVRALIASSGVALGACGDGEWEATAARRFEELRRFDAPAARQGVAVGASHFYAIGNRVITKHDARSGRQVDEWKGSEGGPVIHLNSGVVLDGKLYCAHSNYPAVPMASSIEIFDAGTLEHRGSRSLGIAAGSATWIDRRDDRWWVAFAHYAGRGGEPGKGPEWTTLVAFDEGWRRIAAYTYPPELVARFAGRSNSGGTWGGDGLLYLTGHDAPEVYVLRLPRSGSVLELVEILPAPIAGQGIAWDRSEPGVLYGIVRRDGRVIVSRLVSSGAG